MTILYPRKKLLKNITIGEIVSIAGKSGKVRNYKIVNIMSAMVSLLELIVDKV